MRTLFANTIAFILSVVKDVLGLVVRRPRSNAVQALKRLWLVLTQCLIFCVLLAAPHLVHAHASGEDYVWLSIQADRIDGKFEINFEDLDEKLGIDALNTELSSKEFADAHGASVGNYALERFSINDASAPFTIEITDSSVAKLPEGRFLVLNFEAVPQSGEVSDLLDIEHRLFSENDRLHRGLVLIESNAKLGKKYDENTTLVFASHSTVQQLDLNNPPRLLSPLQFIYQGIIHILLGFDHVLFLILLLLTSVLRPSTTPGTVGEKTTRQWLPVESFREAFINIVGIVTTFTIAHSVTLALAATGVIQLPASIVEPVIALSIVVLAVANFLPSRRSHRVGLIFFFGLFHGLGFAAVMGELSFRVNDLKEFLIGVILSFNVGVELGQLFLVVLIFPVLFLLRRWRGYENLVVRGVSLVVALLGLWWIVERTGMIG